jgi:glyoxylate utilization-related uncharacterized protein
VCPLGRDGAVTLVAGASTASCSPARRSTSTRSTCARSRSPQGAPDTAAADDSVESFVLVKEGKVMASLNGVIRTLGPGGVALVLPGDRLVLTNTGGAPPRTTASRTARGSR